MDGVPAYVALFPDALLSLHAVTGELPVTADVSIASNQS